MDNRLFSKASRMTLGPTQTPRTIGGFFVEVSIDRASVLLITRV